MSVRFQPRLLAVAVSTAILAGWQPAASAQPVLDRVVQGQARITQNGKSLTVDIASNRSVIDWRSFSVPKDSLTRILQPDANSLSVNRVTGNSPSKIDGTLYSNGRLVLVNPAGIAIGKDATVDTAGFTAAAMELTDRDGDRLSFRSTGKDIDLEGRVIARSGDIVLLATETRVKDSGTIQAPQGAVVIAAGRTVQLAAGERIRITGRGLEGIFMEAELNGHIHIDGDAGKNKGKDDDDDGPRKDSGPGRDGGPGGRDKNGLIQADAVGLFAATLHHSGLIQANTFATWNNRLQLVVSGKGSGVAQSPAPAPAPGAPAPAPTPAPTPAPAPGTAPAPAPAPGAAPVPAPPPAAPPAPAPAPAPGQPPAPAPAPAPSPSPAPAPASGAIEGDGTIDLAPVAVTLPPPPVAAEIVRPPIDPVSLAVYTGPAVTPAQSLASDQGEERLAARREISKQEREAAQCVP